MKALPEGAKLVRGIALPATEHHFEDMILNRSKVGEVNGKGTYQLHKLRKALPDIKSRRVCIDIGSQVGLWAMHLVDEFDHVHGFEPVPLHNACFAYNVAATNVTVHAVALSDAPGWLSITVPPSVTGHAHVVPVNPAAGEKDGPIVEAEARTLDSYNFDNVDFIKIDVEGWELPVMRGAEQTLRRCKPWIIVEQKGNDAKVYGQERDGAVGFLKTLGFEVLWPYSGDIFLKHRDR